VAERPAISVVVPFAGRADEAAELAAALAGLETRQGDELIVADNTPAGVAGEAIASGDVTVVSAAGRFSSYRARNVGASRARNEWVLFLDADTRARPDILDRYFSEPVADRTGAVCGPVLPLARSEGVVARYQESRGHDKQAPHLRNAYRPFAVTANLLVRRVAWEAVGGFQDGIRSAGDADFCWRIQEEGWTLEYRGDAQVRHFLRESLRAYLRLHARYGAGRRWLGVRHPAAGLGPRPLPALRRLAGLVSWFLRGQVERGLQSGIDAAVILTETAGYVLGNAGPRWPAPEDGRGDLRVFVMADRFPKPSETFIVSEVKGMAALGAAVTVSARSRPARPALGTTWDLDVRYLEDAGILREVRDLGWLARRHPIRVVTDLASRRRWRAEETVAPLRELAPLARSLVAEGTDHMHVHFARRAALDALRLSRILGIPYSVTAHAWEIFKEPRNLAAKVRSAAFTTTGCDYNVRHLEAIVGPGARPRLHKVVMGVDPERFQRSEPYDGDGTVIAIGRLVPKKGFGDLIEAAARLRDRDAFRRLVIVGDGELREDLVEQARRLGLDECVNFVGARTPEEVRALLESAAVLAMPAVVAPDGDRDSMPVVVKEALAMGVPVVASDEVGLPEVVREEWGRLIPPGDAAALADAIGELLETPADERERMGRRGRNFVVEEFRTEVQARKLMDLIERS
jgi:colanic acid/amylovoran biosynthesis glycosyltransferase